MRETRYKVLSYDSERYQWDGKGDYVQWWYQELIAFCWKSWRDTTIVRQPALMQHVMKVGIDLRWKGQPLRLEGEGVFETMLTGAS